MKQLVLLRHGESTWNRENRFTGWTDVPLSARGTKEAIAAGRTLWEEGYRFDIAYTSVLQRAIKTLWLLLEEMDRMWIPVFCNWRLNERHYGALQGLSKSDTAEKYGAEQVHEWRRSYGVRPPELTPQDERYPGKDPRYTDLPPGDIPLTECLRDTVRRALPFWHEAISPMMKTGKRVLIVAHGNSLRALAKYLTDMSDDDIVGFEIPTGIPLVMEVDEDLRAIRHFYLTSPAAGGQ